MKRVPFNRVHAVGTELSRIAQAIEHSHLSGNGPFTRECHGWLERRLDSPKALLTHSGTAALEMAAIIAGLQPGDEVIMPSFTFVSTANAFALRGAVPVFVDIRPDTLNLDETRIEAAITPRTKAIVPIDYAGVSCDMDAILALAAAHRLIVIEDAAHALLSQYRGKPVGSRAHLAALSFHETKNVTAGEAGALLVNDARFAAVAERVWQKGTNRSEFARGEVDRYTWIELGSSFQPGDLTAAFLSAQFDDADRITGWRLHVWERYHHALEDLERTGAVRRPIVPAECVHNGHLYYLLLGDQISRPRFLADLDRAGVSAVFHYVPLHSSPGGLRYGRAAGDLSITDRLSSQLVRLPLWADMTDADIDLVLDATHAALHAVRASRD